VAEAVPPGERARVESALVECRQLVLPAGSALGPERFETVRLLSIEEGMVFVSDLHRDSSRRIVLSLAGSSSIVVAPAAHERLEALADTCLMLIPTNAQQKLLEITSAATLIIEALESGLRDCRESLAQFSRRRHVDRVRCKLIQLARVHGHVGTEGLLLDLPLTHELIADMVGTTRETVTRSLAQLAQEGLIKYDRGRYLVAAPSEAIAP
jgi:CRP-like cAMP-binding protein